MGALRYAQRITHLIDVDKTNYTRLKKRDEQTVAHGAAGRAVFEINVVRRGPVNGNVPRLNSYVLTNPYAPSTVEHSALRARSARRLHIFAGGWLIVFGLLHFLATNLLQGTTSISAVEWTPLLLSGLGSLVATQFRIAIAFTRIVGSFIILGLVLGGILMLAGFFGDGGQLTYGDMTLKNPQPWQVLLFLATMAATIVPPWWMLQRALAGNHRVHPSTRVGRY